VRLSYRRAGGAAWSEVLADCAAGAAALTIPGLTVAAPSIQYYAAALDAAGAVLSSAADATQPLTLAVAEPPGRSRSALRSAGLWVGVVAGLAVGAAATALVFTLRPPPAGTPANLGLRPH
jgi:hypothetical protein